MVVSPSFFRPRLSNKRLAFHAIFILYAISVLNASADERLCLIVTVRIHRPRRRGRYFQITDPAECGVAKAFRAEYVHG